MQEQDVNNQNPYEIPPNDMTEGTESGGYIGKSPVKDIIDSAANVDPSRFWIVLMIFLFLALAGSMVYGVDYLIGQNKELKQDIKRLEKDLKECPERTREEFKKQQRDIDELRNGAIYNSDKIQELKLQKLQDLKQEEQMNSKLRNIVKE